MSNEKTFESSDLVMIILGISTLLLLVVLAKFHHEERMTELAKCHHEERMTELQCASLDGGSNGH